MGAGVHATPSKGCSTLLFENCQHSSPWTLPSTFTQNAPDWRILIHRSEVTIGRNPTSGGSSDTDENDPMVNPTGSPSNMPVTTVTPVGKWPSTWRYFIGSIDMDPTVTDRRDRPHCAVCDPVRP